MIDHTLRPYLLEINQMPSFATDSPIDIKIKRGLITDVLRTLCLSTERKRKYKAERKAKMQERLLKPQNNILMKEQTNRNAEENKDKDGKAFKEDTLKHHEIQKLEKE